MPLFNYKCSSCDNGVADVIVELPSSETITCDKCGAMMERQFPSSNFQLKGGGWAKDLYSSSAKKKNEKKDSV